MARLVSRASGNWTAAATWKVVEGAGLQAAETAETNSTTAYVNCPAFTVGAGIVMTCVVLLVRRLSSTGTFSVQLSDDNGATATREVVVNTADLPIGTSFVCFVLPSNLTGDGGADYRVGIKSSTAATVAVRRDATAANWTKLIVNNTTQAPVAADILYELGELTGAGAGSDLTVTMNETATTQYGEVNIGHRGIEAWANAAATAYVQRVNGNKNVWGNGFLDMNPGGTRTPTDTTKIQEFVCASAGQFGLRLLANHRFRSKGFNKTAVRIRLSADEAAGQSVISVDTATGWKNGDSVGFGSTSKTASQSEEHTLAADAGATTITLTGTLASAKAGVAPTQGVVVLLTHTNKLRSTSSVNLTYVEVNPDVNGVANVDIDWTEFQYVGTSTSSRYGFRIITGVISGITVDKTSWRDNTSRVLSAEGTATGGWSWTDCVAWKCGAATNQRTIRVEATSATNWTLRGLTVLAPGADCLDVELLDMGGTIEDLLIGSKTSVNGNPGLALGDPNGGTIDGLEMMAIAQNTEWIAASATPALGPTTIRNFLLWRSTGISTNGCIVLSNMVDLTLEDGQILGVGNAIFMDDGTVRGLLVRRVVMSGLTTDGANLTGLCLRPNAAISYIQARFEDCDFGVAAGVYDVNATADLQVQTTLPVAEITLVNCRMGSATEVTGEASMALGSFIARQQHDQTVVHNVLTPVGTLAYDTTITHLGSPTYRLTPSSATVKLRTDGRKRDHWLIAANTSQIITVNCPVRLDAAYNGAMPRLIILANPALDIDADLVLDTHAGGTGAFETLTGATAALPRAGVLEVIVDCDGTAGFVNVAQLTTIAS